MTPNKDFETWTQNARVPDCAEMDAYLFTRTRAVAAEADRRSICILLAAGKFAADHAAVARLPDGGNAEGVATGLTDSPPVAPGGRPGALDYQDYGVESTSRMSGSRVEGSVCAVESRAFVYGERRRHDDAGSCGLRSASGLGGANCTLGARAGRGGKHLRFS